ncbi:MAG: alpha-mannosidase [Actinomycetota bacterium]|nr:alpha-mannosidase [Actinomycetota bacterium]
MPTRTIIHVVPHTHWDREWYEPFEAYRFQLVKVMDRLLEVLDDDPSFRHFNFDGQTAAIEDYLEVRPPVGPEIERFIREGRLAIGPWRILMDEFLCSPETIIRNIRQGSARANAMGGRMELGYIPDSFGHISQMPQILRLAGLKEACVWRGVPFAVDRTAFLWEAPDGTTLRTLYLATSYSNGATLPATYEDLIVRGKRIAQDLAPFKPGTVVLAMNGTDHRGAEDHLPALFDEANTRQDELEFRIGSLREYLHDAPSEGLPRWRGELRSGARANLLMGVASARMPLKQAEFRASRSLERYAEPLSALAGTDTGRLLERAWRGMVENSAHDSICGCGVDAVADQVLARYVDAARIGELVTRDAAETLAAGIDTRSIPEGAEGAVLWNPSPRTRGGAHVVTLSVEDPSNTALVAPDGTRCATQLLEEPAEQVIVDMVLRGTELARIVPTIHSRMIGALTVNGLDIEEGRTTVVRLHLGPVAEGHFDVEEAKRRVEALTKARPRAKFHVLAVGPPLCTMLVEAPAVAGLGWTVLSAAHGNARPKDPVTTGERALRNASIEAHVAEDGTISVTNLESGSVYSGLFGLRDGGDAGDEYNYSPPERDTILSPRGPARLEVLSRGPLEGRIAVHTQWRIPAGLSPNGKARDRKSVPMNVVTEISLRSGEPFLRATITLENRAKDHRVRAHFPLPFTPAVSHAETAFAVAERGREAESGSHEHALATYPCRRWVDASDGARGLALLHTGTPEFELTDDGLAVTLLRSVGWLSRQAMLYRAGPAGPPLETPGSQLLGPHTFSLAVFPHIGTWQNGVYDAAEAFTLPFHPVITRAHAGSLPSVSHGLSIEPASVQLSALTRTDTGLEVRVFNASGTPARMTLADGPSINASSATIVDLFDHELTACDRVAGGFASEMRGCEIATVRLVR